MNYRPYRDNFIHTISQRQNNRQSMFGDIQSGTDVHSNTITPYIATCKQKCFKDRDLTDLRLFLQHWSSYTVST